MRILYPVMIQATNTTIPKFRDRGSSPEDTDRAAHKTDANANSALAPSSGIYTVAKLPCVLTQVLSLFTSAP